jgi:hypothetical protein
MFFTQSKEDSSNCIDRKLAPIIRRLILNFENLEKIAVILNGHDRIRA